MSMWDSTQADESRGWPSADHEQDGGGVPVWVNRCGHDGCVITAPHTHGTGTHVPAPDAGGPWDVCERCEQAIQQHWATKAWVTMQGSNPECYGRKW
jgi:hypothetical protein